MVEQRAEKKFISWADLIRVLAIFLVVVIHVSGQLTNVWGKISTDQWFIADIYGSIARVSVPLFFMMSGYLLLPRSESLRSFYTKRMPKVVIPFVVWSVIYLSVFCGSQPATCTPNYLWQFITLKRTYFHLWFLYSLISIYLILPFLRLIFRPEIDRTILWYLIGLWLIFQPVWATTTQFWNFFINLRARSQPDSCPILCWAICLAASPCRDRGSFYPASSLQSARASSS